jgi:hypothetical protein
MLTTIDDGWDDLRDEKEIDRLEFVLEVAES